MWRDNKEGLINEINALKDREMVAMGQCGVIIRLGEVKIAIDLIISDLYYKGTKISRRVVKPPFDISETPDLDYVLVTHDHADHLDRALIEELATRERPCKVIAPRHILSSLDIPSTSKVLLSDYQCYSDGDVSITPIPVPHMEYKFSEKNCSEFYGYIIRYGSLKLFHGGDLIISENLLEDLKKEAPFNYTFLPINGRDSIREAKGIIGNTDEAEAIELALKISSSCIVPTHFDFFKENGADPAIFSSLAKGKIATIIPVPGEKYSLI